MAHSFRGMAHGVGHSVVLLTLLGALAVPASAQGTMTAYLALKGSAQGAFRGSTTASGHNGEIAAISLTTSQPYGAATPVLHVVSDIAVAPQIVHALVTNEILQTTVVFVKPGQTGTMQQVYQIRALQGYVISATISADDAHAPTLSFDLLLSGGTTYTNETGAATTAPPPSFTGNVPNAHGVVLAGEFKGMQTGDFPSSPNAPMHKGILLDAVSVSISTPVLNGASSGKPLAHPLVIARPTSEDATIFDNARATQETFSKILLHVYETQLNGSLVDVFDIETQGACIDVGNPCASGSGMATGRPGGSTGLSPNGGGLTPISRAGGIHRANDASTTMQFLIPTLTVVNRQNQTTVTYSFAQGRLD